MSETATSLADRLPFRTVVDVGRSSEAKVVFRCNLKNIEDCTAWLEAYEHATCSHWNVRKTYPAMSKLLFRKDFVCHHSGFMKKDAVLSTLGDFSLMNQRGRSKNCKCAARLMMKIFQDTSRDEYVKKVSRLWFCCELLKLGRLRLSVYSYYMTVKICT